jgi:chemotaxis signal transduction protein
VSGDMTTLSVESLRRAFDDAFTREQVSTFEPVERLVAVRVGHEAFAIRIADLASLHATGNVTALPDAPSGLLGLVGIRGQIAAAWDLATLLGYRNAGESRKWLALSAMQRDVALAVGHVEGYLHVEVRRLHDVATSSSAGGQLRQAFDHDGALRRIVSVPDVLANVHRTIAQARVTR